MSKKHKLPSNLIGLILSLALIVILVPVAQFVFGFTSPAGAPPSGGGALFTSGSDLSIGGRRLRDLAAPTASTDAVNREYADAAAGGAGSYITLFGTRGGSISTAPVSRAAGQVQNCVSFYAGTGACNTIAGPPQPAGFSQSDICTSTLGVSSTRIMDGYGPFNDIYGVGGTQAQDDGLGGSREGNIWTAATLEGETGGNSGGMMAGLSNSICSLSHFHLVRNNFVYGFTGGALNNTVVASEAIIGACGAGAGAICNVCTVCKRDQ